VSPSTELNAIVSGIGISRIGRRTGIPPAELTVEAAHRAINDAGLQPSDIDGVVTLGVTPPSEAAAVLGIEPSWTGGEMGHHGLLSPVVEAMRAVSGRASRHVLVFRTVNMMGGEAMAEGGSLDAMPPAMRDIARLLTMHAYAAPNWVAMHLQRHMHLYGTTREQLGWLAVNSRRNAALNPLAAYQEPLTLDQYLDARFISEPLCLYDCDVPVDGSVALIVSTGDATADCDHPVRVVAVGGSTGSGGWDQRPDYPRMASADAAAELWASTDLRPADVDVAELYDGFTFLTLAWIEALGFCGDGEAGAFVEGAARIALDGELPLNTYGGQLSAGRLHGYWLLHEACLQLRGQAGERQVPGDPDVAVAAAGGGPIAGCMLLTRV